MTLDEARCLQPGDPVTIFNRDGTEQRVEFRSIWRNLFGETDDRRILIRYGNVTFPVKLADADVVARACR